MNDPMPWWGTVAMVLALVSLCMTAVLAFTFADRCGSLQRQVDSLRERFDAKADGRIRPASYLPELWATDDEP